MTVIEWQHLVVRYENIFLKSLLILYLLYQSTVLCQQQMNVFLIFRVFVNFLTSTAVLCEFAISC